MMMETIRAQRNIMAINNLGVSLLEKGFYSDALATLKDAVFLLRNLSRDGSPAETSEMAASKLTLAQERLVICTKTGRKDGSSSPQVSLEVLIQSGHFALDRIADICGPTGLSAYPMLLDEPDFETMQEREFDVESAVAIHNFGLAYLCLSHVTKKKATAHKLRESARKLMHMSLSILKMKMRQESIIDETHYCQLLITQAVVLTSYIPLLNEIDDFDEAQAQYDRLIDVRDLLLDIVGPLEALCPTKRAAPAA